MFTARFNKNVHDKSVVRSSEHPSLAPKFCVLRYASLLYCVLWMKLSELRSMGGEGGGEGAAMCRPRWQHAQVG